MDDVDSPGTELTYDLKDLCQRSLLPDLPSSLQPTMTAGIRSANDIPSKLILDLKGEGVLVVYFLMTVGI